MKNPHELIVPALVVLLLASVAVWILHRYGGEYMLYRDLHTRGARTEAVVVTKGVERDGRLVKTTFTRPSDVHRLIVALPFLEGHGNTCTFTVSKMTYDILGRRDELVVTYLPDDPSVCTLPDNLGTRRDLLMSVNAVAVILLLLAAGFCYYVYRSFRRSPPGNPVTLTSDLRIPGDNVPCPRCGTPTAEGYLPTGGGISWRDRSDPVGMPTTLSGLPGTTFWLKRPRLHARRCGKCMIVIFKYGD